MAAFTPGTTYSNFTPGYGSTISYATTTLSGGVYTPSTYTKIAQSIDVKSPEIEVGDVKITSNDSPNRSHEYAPCGLIEPGDTEFEWIYTPAAQATLWTMCGDGNVYSWKEVFPDGSNLIGLGYIKKIGLESKTENEAIKGKITIKFMSKCVFAQS